MFRVDWVKKTLLLYAALLLNAVSAFANTSFEQPDNFLIIEAISGPVMLNSTLEAIYQNNELYLPFSYLTEDISLPLQYDLQTQRLTGWIETESNTVLVDFKDGYARVGKDMFPVSSTDVFPYEDQVYFKLSFIDQLLNTQSEFDFHGQTLKVKSSGNLPFEKELSRRTKQARFDRVQKNKENALNQRLNKNIYMQKDWFQMPFFDLSARYSVSKSRGSERTDNLGYSASAFFLTGNFDSEASIFSAMDREPPIVSLKTSKIDEDGHILGLFKQLEIGDIYSIANAENNGTNNGFGIKLSTESALQAESKSYTIRDTLPLGWQVELYRNDELLGYRNHSQDGFFEFTKIPLLLGKNRFKLVFYGPQGQVKEKEELVLFNGNMLDKGKIRLKLDYVNKNRYLVELRNKPRDTALGQNGLFEIGYGLTDHITLNAAAITDSLEIFQQYPPGSRYRRDKTFASGDVSLFTYGIFSSLGTVVDFEENAATLDWYAQTSLLDWDLAFEHIYYGDAIISRNLINTTFIKNESILRVNKNLSLGFLGTFPISYSFRHFVVRGGDTQTEHRVSLSHSLPFNTYFNALYDNESWLVGRRNEQLSLTLNHLHGKWNLRSNLIQDFVYHRIANVDFSAYYNLTSNLKWGARYAYVGRDLNRGSYESLYATSLNWQTKYGYISFETGTSNHHNTYAFVGYNISMLPDIHNRNVYMSPNKLHGTGALSSLAFLDENSNGVRDPEERVLKEAAFTVKPAVSQSINPHQTKEGGLLVTHVPAYRVVEVTPDTSNVQETLSLLNTSGSRLVRVRPAQIAYLEFPMVGTGDIEGTVYINKKPARGIIVELYKGEELISSKISEYDGFYSFPQVPLGGYQLRIDKKQQADLEITSAPEATINLANYEQLEVKDIYVEMEEGEPAPKDNSSPAEKYF